MPWTRSATKTSWKNFGSPAAVRGKCGAEDVVQVDPEFWRGKRILLTGHNGFKGRWAALWLSRMGAEITGLALAPDTEPNLYGLAGVDRELRSILCDVRTD